MALMKNMIRIGVIGTLAVGAAVVIAGPHRLRAVVGQARSSIHTSIDKAIGDPAALRIQLRSLEQEYPDRIAEVESDLNELRVQIGEMQRLRNVDAKAAELARADHDALGGALARIEDESVALASAGASERLVVSFRGRLLEVDEAYRKADEAARNANAFVGRVDDADVSLARLRDQEAVLTDLLARLSEEQADFQAQLWQLDREVDAIARNDRVLEIMKKRQQRIDEYSRYEAHSLEQIKGRLAEKRSKQDAQFARATAGADRENYEQRARIELDRDRSGAKSEAAATPTAPARTRVIPATPVSERSAEQRAESEADEGATSVARKQ